MIGVIVVDDQALVRAGFMALLRSDPDIEVVAEAADGIEAVEAVARHRPDVVLMDIRMPRMDGIEATRRVLAVPSPPYVLVLTTYDTDDNVFDALEAGAVGFLVKDTPPLELLRAVKAAVAGGAVISPTTTRRLVHRIVAARTDRVRPRADQPRPAALDLLTERETDVLRLVAAGCSNREIAGRLVISELTAKTHVSRMLAKLGLGSRVQAAVFAYEKGLVRPGHSGTPVPPSR